MLATTILLIILTIITPISGQTLPSTRPRECTTTLVTEQDLANEVFSHYGNWERPVRDVSRPININLALAISSISDVLEKYRTIKLNGYLSVRWFDELRAWNKTFPLNCITYVVLPATNVWLPDIAMMNAEGRYTLMNLDGEKVRIYSDGFAIYSPGGTFAVFCEYDLALFPFDEQMCVVKFESWRYTHAFMTFNLFEPNIKIYQWLENEQWELVNTSQTLFGVSYMDPDNSFDRVEFYLHIRRKSRYYLIAVIIPGSIIALAQVSIFALPLEEVQKVSILFTCLLAYLVFMLMIVGDVPRSSDRVPLLSTYVDVSMALIAMSILGECLVFTILRRAKTHHPDGPGFAPRWLGKFSVFVAKFLRIRPYFPTQRKHPAELMPRIPTISNSSVVSIPNISLENNVQQNNHKKADDTSDDVRRQNIKIARVQWHFIADVTDRFILAIYFLSIVIVPIIMFIIIPFSSYKTHLM